MTDKGSGAKILFNIVCIIFSCVFIISIIKFVFIGNTVSFAGFLEYISACPTIDVSYSNTFVTLGDWPSWAMWIRGLLEVFALIANVIWWLCRNIANLLVFIVYFVSYLFI